MGWHVRFVPKVVMNFEDGRPEICQLVAYNLTDIVIKERLGARPRAPAPSAV
jgi:acetoacetate decarboxylase